MKSATGDIWEYHTKFWPIVIPTNIGWRSDGRNVMGAGLAKQCLEKFPYIDKILGYRYRSGYQDIYFDAQNLIFFPTKPLKADEPFLSWRQKSDIDLIKKNLHHLQIQAPNKFIAIPLVGCGNGGLSRDDVFPLMESILDERFLLVGR